MKVSIKHRLEYALVRTLMVGLGWLPDGLAYGGMGFVGQLIFLCSKRRQGYALKFLRQAYPQGKTDKELLALARRATGNCLKFSIDVVRLHQVLRKGNLDKYVEGLDRLRADLPDGPVLGITGHLGSWEVGATLVASVREAHVIVRSFANPLLHRLFQDSRRSVGLHLYSRRGGIRSLIRALQNGAVGLQVVDQNQRLRGVFVPFFGKLASTERAAATLAVRSGYPVAVCFCPRVGNGFRFRVYVAEVIWPEKRSEHESVADQAKRLVGRINARLEREILRYPEQYLWVHDRYRTQPLAEPVATAQATPQPAPQANSLVRPLPAAPPHPVEPLGNQQFDPLEAQSETA